MNFALFVAVKRILRDSLPRSLPVFESNARSLTDASALHKKRHTHTHTYIYIYAPVSTILNSRKINSVSQESDAHSDDYKGEKMRNMVLFFKSV